MRLERWTFGAAVTCAALATALPAAAQETILLRFRPAVGHSMQTLWWFDVTSTISSGRVGDDDLTMETNGVQSLTVRVIGADGDRRTLEVTRDSIRVRTRPLEGTWRAWADTGGARPRARLTVDERLRGVDFQVANADSLTTAQIGALRAFSTGFEFTFPEQAVAVGQVWAADIVIPLDEPTGVEGEPGVSLWLSRVGEIVARSTLTLDSLVDRGTDTLAFLQVQGTLLPTTVASAAEATEGRARLTGAVAGRLIWSTGWHAFVSGAVRLRVRMVAFAGSPDTEVPSFTMNVDTSSRFQVRR